MKILTWNLERLKSPSKRERILSEILKYDADIVVLTETSEIMPLPDYTKVSSAELPTLHDDIKYSKGENRVSMWTKYNLSPVVIEDAYTSVCADVDTPLGMLRIYGTIIGVFGGRGTRFGQDLKQQLKEFEELFPNKNVCIIGDLNTTFSGYVYPSHAAQHELINTFRKFDLTNLTASIPDNVDHIVISKKVISPYEIEITIFNEDKSLSDHIGICIFIKTNSLT